MDLTPKFKAVFYTTLHTLLTETFRNDYFTANPMVKNVIKTFLKNTELAKSAEKKFFLSALETFEPNSITDDKDLFFRIKYHDFSLILYVFEKLPTSQFSSLNLDEKELLVILDLFQSSALHEIFYDSGSVFSFPMDDFFVIMKSLGFNKNKFLTLIKQPIELELIEFDETKNILKITDSFFYELQRLENFPKYEKYDLMSDFDVEGDVDSVTVFKNNFLTTFSGNGAAPYIYSLLVIANQKFWYVNSLKDYLGLLSIFSDSQNKIKNQLVWFDNFPEMNSQKEEGLFLQAQKASISLIVSGEACDNPFGKKCIKVTLKEDNLEDNVKKSFSEELSNLVIKYLSEIQSVASKMGFFQKIKSFKNDNDEEQIIRMLPDYFLLFKKNMKDDSEQGQKFIIDDEVIRKRYGNLMSAEETPFLNEHDYEVIKIIDKLKVPVKNLTITPEKLNELEQLFSNYPNLIDRELFFSLFKNSCLFSDNNQLNLNPIVLEGPKGCGKTRLVKKIQKFFNQINLYFQVGIGQGVDSLQGNSASYRNATYGSILSNSWTAIPGYIVPNYILLCDEIDKICISNNVSDVNMNLYPMFLALLGDENRNMGFSDNFLDIPLMIKPNFIFTANDMSGMPAPFMDRVTVVKMRPYTSEEMMQIVIPAKFKQFREESKSKILPEKLEEREIETVFAMCSNSTRKVDIFLGRYLTSIYNLSGQRHQLDENEEKSLIESSRCYSRDHSIGFFR